MNISNLLKYASFCFVLLYMAEKHGSLLISKQSRIILIHITTVLQICYRYDKLGGVSHLIFQ